MIELVGFEIVGISRYVLGFFLLLLIVLPIISSSVKQVSQFERGLVERFGAYRKTVEPGLNFIVPFMDRVLRINMREQVIGRTSTGDHHRG